MGAAVDVQSATNLFVPRRATIAGHVRRRKQWSIFVEILRLEMKDPKKISSEKSCHKFISSVPWL